jgi:hypothetical protein
MLPEVLEVLEHFQKYSLPCEICSGVVGNLPCVHISHFEVISWKAEAKSKNLRKSKISANRNFTIQLHKL